MEIFEIILGSYESFVIGVKFRFKNQVSVQLFICTKSIEYTEIINMYKNVAVQRTGANTVV